MKRFKETGKKLLALMLAGIMVFGLCSCDEDDWDDWDDEDDWDYEDDDDDGYDGDDGGNEPAERIGDASPMQMTVNKETGEMSIERPVFSGEAMGEEGTWTVFVYICGSDLESDGGAAVSDIYEMCDAAQSDDVRFVVQTGGAYEWSVGSIESDRTQRFLVEDGDITNVYDGNDANMGDSDTLADFLVWGISNYPADNMGLIFWDHGSGAITGACFDENHDNDSLTLREIDSSLLTAQQYMTEKWEFIGFDACLMGSIEMANICASYAKYMYGSEEVEPGAGWNYTEIGSFLASNPDADGAELGRVVCDSFYEGCIADGDYDCCTLSVTDLSRIDNVITSFNTFSQDIYENGGNADDLSTMIREIEGGICFGSNNDNEGYTNMVDLVSLVTACSDYSTSEDAVISAINDAVIYKIHGADHPDACGLSIYFPIMIGGSEELKVFSDICPSPFYMSFLDRRDYSASIYYVDDDYGRDADYDSEYYYDEEEGIYYFVQDGEDYCYEESTGIYYVYNESTEYWEETDDPGLDADQYEYSSSNQISSYYSDDYMYDDDGYWNWNCDYDYDSSSCYYRSNPTQTDRFDYLDEFEATGDSAHIKFLRAPSLDDEGIFRFTLTKYSLDHTADVYAVVYLAASDDELLELGDTYDIDCDWENGSFADVFDGYWISLPDGQNLSTTIVEANDDFVIYTSPILLNGTETNLRFRQTLDDGIIVVEGTWDGVTDSGASSRSATKLKDGDVITPLYTSFTFDDIDTDIISEGVEYTVNGELELYYDLLPEGDYYYTFVIEDVYRDCKVTDSEMFYVDEDGYVSYYID